VNNQKILVLLLLLWSNFNFLNAQNTIGTIYNSTAAEEGYTLFEYMGDTTIYLIDNCGQVINQWESDFLAGTSIYLLEDGSIIRAGKTPTTYFSVGGQGGVLEKFDWDGNLLWQYFYSDSLQSLHHDIAVMPNGNILAIAFELKSKQEAIDNGRDSLLISENKLWPEKIIELEPQGTSNAIIVWEWHMWDHLVQDYDDTKLNYGVVAEHPELFNLNYMSSPIADWAHANSLDYNASLDHIAISLNSFNEFVIIDHSTSSFEAASSNGGNSGKGGDILYRYGNPESYGHGDSTNRVNYKQHNVHWISDGLSDAGKIMFYNNGNGRPDGAYSSIDIITPLTDVNGNYILEADTTFGPDSAEWSYASPIPTDFYSPMISGTQRLPNGNTLICQGRDGRIFEIDENEDIVWEYWSPINNIGTMTQGDTPSGNRNVFRALRYGPSFSAFFGNDLTPKQPIELNPDLSACKSVGMSEFSDNNLLHTYPNPVLNYLTIAVGNNSCECIVDIYDIYGKIVYKDMYSSPINLSALNSGVYFVYVAGQTSTIIKE
jgi:hypothetical protein